MYILVQTQEKAAAVAWYVSHHLAPTSYLSWSICLWSSVWGCQLWWSEGVCTLQYYKLMKARSWDMAWNGQDEESVLSFLFGRLNQVSCPVMSNRLMIFSLTFCTEATGIWGGPNLLKRLWPGGKDLLFLSCGSWY